MPSQQNGGMVDLRTLYPLQELLLVGQYVADMLVRCDEPGREGMEVGTAEEAPEGAAPSSIG